MLRLDNGGFLQGGFYGWFLFLYCWIDNA
jgi:hypothetical protein